MSNPAPKKDLTGRAFERLVAAVQKKLSPGAKVEWDVKVKAKSGAERQIDVMLRQIDVMVRGKMHGEDVAIAIEAKDRNKPVTINMVGDFHASFTGIGAQYGIMVSSLGFTEDGLLEAKYRGIETCILRPAKDEDWKGYLRMAEVSILPQTQTYEDSEIELVTGERLSASTFSIFLGSDGKTEYFDLLMNTAMSTVDWKWEDGKLMEVLPKAPLFYRDKEVAVLRCTPRTRTGPEMLQLGILLRPEDWIFVQQTPTGFVDEKSFFVFAELEKLANDFEAKKAAAKGTKRTRKPRRPRRPK